MCRATTKASLFRGVGLLLAGAITSLAVADKIVPAGSSVVGRLISHLDAIDLG